MSNNYTGEDIKVLNILEAIRTRPGMYIGEPEDPRHLLVEAVDNAMDEAMNGYSDLTIIKYNTKTYEVEVTDFGRGIPQDDKEIYDHNGKPSGKAPALEILFTFANSGGKFSNDSFKISGGLHGLGNKIINSLSNSLYVQSRRDNKKMTYESHNGGLKLGLTTEMMKRGEKNGTTIRFIPNPDIFDTPSIPTEFIINKCHIANSSGYPVELYIDEERVDLGSGKFDELLPDLDGASEYLRTDINVEREDGQSARVLIQYTSDTKSDYNAFTNLVMNARGGNHVYLLHDAIMDAWSPYIKDRTIKPQDTLLGTNYVVSVYISEPAFSSQTKEKLTVKKRTQQYEDMVDLFKKVTKEFGKYLKNNPEYRNSLLTRFEEYRRSMSRLQSQKEIDELVIINNDTEKTGKVRRRSIVRKLVECSSPQRDNTEIFITEGDSASGNLLKTRDTKTQAVFPIRGKILNVAKVPNLLHNLRNEEVLGIVNAAGTGVGEDCDPSKSRYARYFIGCFTGDTRVKLLNGTTPSFEELVAMEAENPGQEYWTYSSKPDGKVVPGKATNPHITRYTDELIEMTLDDGSVIKCTPDHKFMMRDGKYKEAKDLVEYDSLMPMNTRIGDEADFKLFRDRELVYDNYWEKYIPAQYLVYDHENPTNPREKGYVVHHRDHNHRNNYPDNLVKWTKKEHDIYHLVGYNKSDKHREQVASMNSDESIIYLQKKGKIVKSLYYMIKNNIPINEENYYNNHLYGAQSDFNVVLENYDLNDLIEEALSSEYDLSTYKKSSEVTRHSTKGHHNPYDTNSKQRKQVGNVVNRILIDDKEVNKESYDEYRGIRTAKWERATSEFFSSSEEMVEYAKTYNHKVRSVKHIKLDEPIPVYCMTVEKYHNFTVLGSGHRGEGQCNNYSGVVAHNCDSDP